MSSSVLVCRSLAGLRLAGLSLAAGLCAWGQSAPAPAARTLHGTLTDSLHDRPIARALVRINQRAVLTDALGRFAFPGYMDTQAYVSVSKPGFSASADGSDGAYSAKVADLDAPILVQLVPDAIVTGVVIDRTGQPLPRVQVAVLRARYDQPGITAGPAGNATTDSHGRYRLSLPPGQVRLQTRYFPSLEATGETLLPVSSPEQVGGRAPVYERLQPGQEQRLDLHPGGGIPYPVQIRPLGAEAPRQMRVTAMGRNGIAFQVFARPAQPEGLYTVELPPGTYKLTFDVTDRDNASSASMRVTIPPGGLKAAIPIDLALAPLATLPVELAIDSASQASGSSLPALTGAQLNLRLQNQDDPAAPEIRTRTHPDQTIDFQVPPGRYRLGGASAGAWSIISASYGVSNLLTDEIVVGEGAGVSPMRIVASSLTGHLDGTVRLPAGILAARVYLLPREPALVPFYVERVGAQGNFARNLPPGHYAVVATAHTVEADLRDPRAAAKLAGQGKVVEITSGGKASVAVELAPGFESVP